MLGGEGQGFKLAMAGLDGGRLSIGSCSIGAAQASFDMAREHLGDRQQFGRALSTNQALQFKLADMQAQLHVGRSIVRQAARAMDDANPDKTALCAMAKRVATDAGFQVCNEAVQLFGGYGYLADYGVERNLRDVRVMQILEGTNEIMRVILARDILSASH
jgi:alkylation response protein AidB-like acyl-CoA dehydrogenase